MCLYWRKFRVALANLTRRQPVSIRMDISLLERKFDSMGARLKVVRQPTRRLPGRNLVSLDIGTDRRGEFFEMRVPPTIEATIEVLDIRPRDRHLLLLTRESSDKHKFLCGHDERHWFVAGIPETSSVGTVRQATEALKPAAVRAVQARKKLSGNQRNRRKNAAFLRQGEWFFIPISRLVVHDAWVLRNEPLSRGHGSKPHWAEFCYRTGGETVYVCSRYPSGVTEGQYRRILSRNRSAGGWHWMTMRRNPGVYVRGRIRHPDHKTIVLHDWHQVVMNTENQSQAMRHVTFLD